MIMTFKINRFCSLVNSSELSDDEGPAISYLSGLSGLQTTVEGALLLLHSNSESKLCLVSINVIISLQLSFKPIICK